MKTLKNSMGGIALCLFEIIVGILLLINPIGFTTGIITGAGILLLFLGIGCVIQYFRTEAELAATGQYLVKGLIALLAGVFCICKAQWFIVTFPALTIIYGIAVLIAGLGKVQLTVDMLRRKSKKWFLAIISAVLSIACAAVILNNPFTSTAVLWMFTGVTLIVESLIDLVTCIFNGREQKEKEASEA